ncbi:glycosyltransferase [Flavobacteriaceae bacterium LMO-SS05]
MISVLIPVYNYPVFELVKAIHRQLLQSKLPFEIICLEDGSDKHFIESNKTLNTFSNTRLLISRTNKGRELSRQQLAENSTYETLLFLDADTLPVHQNFISIYSEYFNSEYQAIFGGIIYRPEKPKTEYVLRWAYGKAHEQIDAKKRNQNRYNTITSANFLIDKQVFLKYNSNIVSSDYGFDAYFSSLLKRDRVIIKHIDNAVFHLGIEKSKTYLNKKEEAARTLLMLYNQNKITKDDNNLLALFVALKRFKLGHLFSFFYKVFGSQLKKQLLGKHPYIPLLQLYRILYLCHVSSKKPL